TRFSRLKIDLLIKIIGIIFDKNHTKVYRVVKKSPTKSGLFIGLGQFASGSKKLNHPINLNSSMFVQLRLIDSSKWLLWRSRITKR
ncbi:hypothetical protein, partial [Pseudoalteromonas sp. PS5]|uniref:hypothetical protein n=1 Tax=Pseudoalteromonas sp. PS5 TaxID=1437473 RepID=UPI001027DBDA